MTWGVATPRHNRQDLAGLKPSATPVVVYPSLPSREDGVPKK
jgi:hypothetical protein